MTDMLIETTDPLPASGPAEAAEQVRAGERVTDRYAEPEPTIDETPLEPQDGEPLPAAVEQSPDYKAGFEAALEEVYQTEAFEYDAWQREQVFEQLGERLGMPAADVQRAMEQQALQQFAAEQQQQLGQAEQRQRLASLHSERTEILSAALIGLGSEVGTFDHEEALAEAQRLAQEEPELAEDPRALLRLAAWTSAERLADGNAVIDDAIERVNRYVGANPEEIRWIAERAFDESAPDQRGAVAEAVAEAFAHAPKPVRLGTRVTDRYAELSQLHREMADQTPPPRPELKVQLRDTGQLRDGLGRFISAERVTDRHARLAAEAEQEQKRLAAHKQLMKGLL
jgi:hypothetical protein